MKKAIFLTVLSALLLTAASCSEKPKSDVTSAVPMEAVKSDRSYRLETLDMPVGNGNLLGISSLGEDKFLTAFGVGEPSYTELQLYIADDSFKNYTSVDIPFEVGDESRIAAAMCPDGDSAFLAVTRIVEEEYSHILFHIGADGSIISQTELSNIGETEIYSIAACDGKIYVSTDTVYEVTEGDGTGTELSSAVYAGELGVTDSGEFCFEIFEDTESFLKIGDRKLSLQSCGSLVSNIAGGGGFESVFATNTGVFGVSGNTVTELATNIGLGLRERSISEIYPTAEGFVINAFDTNLMQNRLYLITDVAEDEEVHEQITLKVGIFYEEDDFSAFMAQQNGSDSYVKIEPVYYTQYDVYDKNADKQVSTGLDQLNMDLISGNAPDMAVFMKTPQYLFSKGVFADLYTIMDDKLSRDDLMPNVLEACEVNGKLYSLPTSYDIWSMTCKDKFSPVKNQSFDDMLNTLGNAPDGTAFLPTAQRSEILTNFLSYSDFAVDCKNGVCSVNGDNIQRLLEFCGTFPERFEYPADYVYEAAMNESVYNEFVAESFGDFRQYFKMMSEPVTFTGYPSENGCGTVIVPVHTVAVLENCENKDAAWELIKCMYNSTNITNGINSGFPVVRDTFDKWVQAAKMNMSEDEVTQAEDTINSAKSLGRSIDNAIHMIIREESDAYFAGEYTAEQAADFIKNRTDIYVSEKS